MSKLENQLKTICSPFMPGIEKIQEGSLQTASQLTQQRLSGNNDLRRNTFYVGDFLVSLIQENQVVFYLGKSENNPFLNNPTTYLQELTNNGYCILQDEDKQKILESVDSGTKRFTLSSLNPNYFNNNFSCLLVPTSKSKYNNLPKERRLLTQSIYSTNPLSEKPIFDLNKAKKQVLGIYFPSESFVRKYAGENAIAQTCLLLSFYDGSNFIAGHNNLNTRNNLRGIPK